MTAPLLKVSDLSVVAELRSGAAPLLSDVAFELAPRSVLGVIGESGSGKTVLSRALVNWLKPPLRAVSGRVEYQGRNLLAASAAEIARIRGREIAYIGANPTSALDPTLPVGRQIVEKLRAVKPEIAAAEARERVIATLEAVRIPSPAKRFHEFPFQFSGGMMQRALIVDALVADPRLLIADNITQSLDVTVAAQILRLLRELQRQFDTAVIFISSSLGMVADIADEVMVLDEGRIVERQATRRLIDAPAHAYTRLLIEKAPKVWSAPDEAPPAPTGAEVLLAVRDAHRSYKVRDFSSLFAHRIVQAVRGVSFDVLRGENFGIIGESGCGKSTLSRLLSRLEPLDRGEIRYEGQDVARLRGRALLDLRRRFQLILQDPFNAIPGHASIGRTIAEPLYIHRFGSSRQIRGRVFEVMQEVGLSTALHDELPVGLSAGQRQRVNIARAMALEPDLLILDETLSALDQVEQAKLLDLFESIQRRHRMTYIYISHDLAMVRRVCGRIMVMYLGRVVEEARNHAMFFRAGHPYTRALLSAVPTVEVKPFDTETYLMEGEPPDPINIPPGCSFRTRCPFAFSPCAIDDPPLMPHGADDFAACHLMRADVERHPLFWSAGSAPVGAAHG